MKKSEATSDQPVVIRSLEFENFVRTLDMFESPLEIQLFFCKLRRYNNADAAAVVRKDVVALQPLFPKINKIAKAVSFFKQARAELADSSG